MTVTLQVDKSLCGGAGLCRAMYPDLFTLGADGLSEPLKTELTTAEEIEAAEDVVGCCPTEAIVVTGLDDA